MEKEEEAIRDILGGNVNRYEEIVREYQGIVADLCYKMGGSNLDIEEMTQQVFVELYTALPRFKFQSKLSTFIYRITVNVVCKEFKHQRRYQTGMIDTALQYQPKVGDRQWSQQESTPSVEQDIIHQERLRQLRQAIALLNREQRTALVLYTYDDFSYQQIADVMQCTVAKVESLIFRARKNLKKMLTDKI